jgi:hypothetical protein
VVRSHWFLLVFIAMLSGCQPVVVQRLQGPVPVTVRVDDAAYWLEEWHRAIALPEDKLLVTLNTREQEFERAATARSGLRLALLLTEGPRAVRDQDRALALLKGLDLRNASESARALAAMLQQVIEEQQWSVERIAELRTQGKESEARIQELERQLQELTDIEQTIQQRN